MHSGPLPPAKPSIRKQSKGLVLLAQAEKLNGRACMVGYFLALGVDKLTGAGLVDQQSSFLGLLSLHVVVFAVLLFPTIDRIQVRNWRCGRGRCFSLRSQALREAFAARRRLCRAASSPSTASRCGFDAAKRQRPMLFLLQRCSRTQSALAARCRLRRAAALHKEVSSGLCRLSRCSKTCLRVRLWPRRIGCADAVRFCSDLLLCHGTAVQLSQIWASRVLP